MERTTPDNTPGLVALEISTSARTAWLGLELPDYQRWRREGGPSRHHVFNLIQSSSPCHSIQIHDEAQFFALIRSAFDSRFTDRNPRAQKEICEALDSHIQTFPMSAKTQSMIALHIKRAVKEQIEVASDTQRSA